MSLRQRFFKYAVYYPVVNWKAGNLRPALDLLTDSQHWPRERLEEFQLERLRALVSHAGAHVPAFRRKLSGDPPAMTSLEDVRRLPTLVKTDIQGDPAGCASDAAGGKLVKKTTGGSTGQPVTVWKTRDAWLWELAATWRGYAWAGVEIGDPQARFWGVPFEEEDRRTARLTDFACHRRRLSAFSFDEASLAGYVEDLRRFRPTYFYGYVSMVEQFARYVEEEVPDWDLPLTCIITTSEVLTDAIRERLETTFQTRVFNEYGCGEIGTIAHECEEGRLHLSEENMLVEVLDGDRPCAPGEAGELVVTELNNQAMPLIRYRMGDFGSLSAEACPCGRTLRVLEGLHGRAYDMVRNREGRLFHGEFIMYIFEEIKREGPGIKQFQVIQDEVDRFRVRVVREEGYGPQTEALVVGRIREHIDPAAEVVFESAETIERENSGKLRVIIGLGSRDPEVADP